MLDPNDDCIFVKEQKAKKKASKLKLKTPSRIKHTTVTLMVIKDIMKGVPRGAYKDSLLKSNMTIPVRLHREMSSCEVHTKLKKALEAHFTDYTILECNGVKLNQCSEQLPSGALLIESAAKRRGNAVYVTKKMLDGDDCSSEVSCIVDNVFKDTSYMYC